MNDTSLDIRILSYVFSDKKILLSIATSVRSEYFCPEFRVFWDLVLRCFEKYKEIPTIEILKHVAGISWEQIEPLYVSIQEYVPNINPHNFLIDLEKLKERFNNQLLRKAGQHVFQRLWDGQEFSDIPEANKIFRDTVAKIDQLYKTESYKEGTLSETASEAWTKYQRAKKDPGSAAGIHLGFSELDRITNGVRDGELLLIGGESGTGKSALAMNMAVNAWLGQNKVPTDLEFEFIQKESGVSIVYFTIEMPYESLERRLHSCISGVPLYGIRDGTLDEKEEKRYRAALRFIQKYSHQFHIIDIPRGATMGYIENKYIELCNSCPNDPPKLVVVDYLNLMSLDSDEGQDWLKIGRLAEQAHEFTRAHTTPMISPVQLNRTPKEEAARNSRPDQDRIARSLMLVQNASIVITIEKRRDEHLMKDMKVHIVKMRDGEQGLFVLQKKLNVMRLFDDITDWTPSSCS